MVPERDVEVGGHIAELAHEEDEDQRGGQLQYELGLGRKAEVLFLLELLVVVQEAYRAEDEREEQAEDVAVFAAHHRLEAHGEADGGHGGDEHEPAHGGSALFRLVPGGAVLAYGLPGLNPAQPGHEESAHAARNEKAYSEGECQSYRHLSLFLFSSISATISRSSMCRFSCPTI